MKIYLGATTESRATESTPLGCTTIYSRFTPSDELKVKSLVSKIKPMNKWESRTPNLLVKRKTFPGTLIVVHDLNWRVTIQNPLRACIRSNWTCFRIASGFPEHDFWHGEISRKTKPSWLLRLGSWQCTTPTLIGMKQRISWNLEDHRRQLCRMLGQWTGRVVWSPASSCCNGKRTTHRWIRFEGVVQMCSLDVGIPLLCASGDLQISGPHHLNLVRSWKFKWVASWTILQRLRSISCWWRCQQVLFRPLARPWNSTISGVSWAKGPPLVTARRLHQSEACSVLSSIPVAVVPSGCGAGRLRSGHSGWGRSPRTPWSFATALRCQAGHLWRNVTWFQIPMDWKRSPPYVGEMKMFSTAVARMVQWRPGRCVKAPASRCGLPLWLLDPGSERWW